MRYTPAAAALSLLLVVTASAGLGAERTPDPRAASLTAEGRVLLESGDVQGAIDSFEAALAVDPGHTPVYLDLADAARAEDLQGKAIHYYRVALERDPKNLAAISGEGAAMVEKGALAKARRNLAQLESLCGESCPEAMELATVLERGEVAQVMTAEAATPETAVAQN